MGMTIYLKKGGKERELATYGYGKFNFSRGYWMACYDIEFTARWLNFRCPKDDILRCTKDVLPLFANYDCEGALSNRQLKGIVREIKSLPAYSDAKWLKDYYGEYAKAHGEDEILRNVSYLWREEAIRLIGILEKAADSGGKVDWS